MLLCTLAAQLFFWFFFSASVHKIQIYATLSREESTGHTAEQNKHILNNLNQDNVRNVTTPQSINTAVTATGRLSCSEYSSLTHFNAINFKKLYKSISSAAY